MQKVTREVLLEKAKALLADGTVNRVLGWKKGEFTYDVTPAVFTTVEELDKDFVYGEFCGANFSKYLVKEAVVEYLTPYIAQCDTKRKAETLLTDRLEEIEAVADKVLRENGFDYTSSAGVKNEKFPTRVYGSLTLSAGFYDALIINLGSGSGDNWWCVVYPPLCFTGDSGAGYVYKSKIMEIIDDFFSRNKEEK